MSAAFGLLPLCPQHNEGVTDDLSSYESTRCPRWPANSFMVSVTDPLGARGGVLRPLRVDSTRTSRVRRTRVGSICTTMRRRREPVMDFLRPASWEEALAAKAEHPTAVPIAGGTDVMVEINFDHRRPEYLLDLNRIGDLYEWEVGEDTVRLGASVPYSKIMESLRGALPGLALASHTVASPQIRNRGGV